MSHRIGYRDIPIGQAASRRTQRYTGSWRSFRPEVDREKCTKCGLCVVYCPEASIVMTDKGTVFDYDYCKGCGICAHECPVEAIFMEREEL